VLNLLCVQNSLLLRNIDSAITYILYINVIYITHLQAEK